VYRGFYHLAAAAEICVAGANTLDATGGVGLCPRRVGTGRTCLGAAMWNELFLPSA